MTISYNSGHIEVNHCVMKSSCTIRSYRDQSASCEAHTLVIDVDQHQLSKCPCTNEHAIRNSL
ncbi:hypothetical protein A359_02810 [secondary endosymbiont of Ctenarytaina eucalypti]|uniref:Uncharacterized protein n=1 Tax=secondary endosymbiont of Ctenarytaina eucalypti TaxID=1199245 RepID=J3YRI4_9ENTR|nr:hypothetical protein A359_02810 [secondary endosymbiont of Ctenarytaina eucalypti]